MWRVAFLASCLFTATQATAFTEGGTVLGNNNNGKARLNNQENEQAVLDNEAFGPLLERLAQRMNQQEQQDEGFPVPDKLDNLNLYGNDEQDFEFNPDFQQQQQYERKPYDFSIEDLEKAEAELEEELKKDREEDEHQDKPQKTAPAAPAPAPVEQQQKQPKVAPAAAAPNEELIEEQEIAGEPKVPQKKGQSEFVSFVEPVEQQAKQIKSSQVFDKRAPMLQQQKSHTSFSSSLLLLAVGTVMSVGLVGTVAGGAYYLKRRNETPDDGEYAPYAGTGPGFKKNKGNQGDETLAYKAQLHQYQQAKQKIICGEDAPGMIESDGEDGADEENNFSVYECPGLAPTGDIEVCNPNFAAQP
ncbi:unnamed protein product [Caenorhabditis angaria]|uniref:Uncharacterized protein n=1 Tax=Caenorhabditis angaria TaxID=860376 RepID=A0A9P1N7Z4_9PELO|nr:unnamed protein product [Caenorhabditis angaria]